MCDFEMGPLFLAQSRIRFSQSLLNRSKQQRQRCAKFMTDVGEEGGFGPVNFGQSLSPFLFFLIGPGICNCRGNLRRDKIQEATIDRKSTRLNSSHGYLP